MNKCKNLSHGITCLDERFGPGAYCRRCPAGYKVSPEDAKKRLALERLRYAQGALQRLIYDCPQFIVQPWMEVLVSEDKKILGSLDPHPTLQAPNL